MTFNRLVRSPFVLAMLVALSLYSCVMSRGSTYSQGASSESSAAAASEKAKAEEEARKAQGQAAPVFPPAGGYAQQDSNADLALAEIPRKAHLLLRGLPPGASIWIDGSEAGSLFPPSGVAAFDIDPGMHAIIVRAFGYEDFEADVSLYDTESHTIEVSLRPAAFALKSIEAWPGRFNRADPGTYGSTLVSVETTAEGRILLEVMGTDGRVVRRSAQAVVGSGGWSWRWDGKDDTGLALTDGKYDIVARDGAGMELGRCSVVIDHRVQGRSSTMVSGAGGLLFVPSPRAALPGGVETTAFLMGHVAASAPLPAGRLVTGMGARLGIESNRDDPNAGMEIDLSAMGIFHPGEGGPVSSDAFVADAAFLLPLTTGRAMAAALFRFGYGSFLDAGDWPSPYDGLARFPGFSVALPLEADAGPLRFLVAPEFEIGTFYPWYDPAEVPGFYSWGYLRAGVESTAGPLSLGFSVALRSLPFPEGLGLSWPLPAGFELRWHDSGIPLVLSLLLTGEFDSMSNWYLASGLAAGYRF